MSSDSEILAATLPEARYETLIRVSNAIGTYRDPQDLFRALVRELHRVVQFDSVGVSIHDLSFESKFCELFFWVLKQLYASRERNSAARLPNCHALQ